MLVVNPIPLLSLLFWLLRALVHYSQYLTVFLIFFAKVHCLSVPDVVDISFLSRQMNYNFPGFCTIPHLKILLQLNVFLVTQNLGIMTCNIYVRLDHIALQAGIVIIEKAKRILRPSFALKLEALLKIKEY